MSAAARCRSCLASRALSCGASRRRTFGSDSLILQVHGSSDKLDAFIDLLRPFGLVELVRSGKLLMARGERIT